MHYGIEHSLGTAKIRLNAIPDKEIFYCVIRSHVKNVLHGDFLKPGKNESEFLLTITRRLHVNKSSGLLN